MEGVFGGVHPAVLVSSSGEEKTFLTASRQTVDISFLMNNTSV